MCYLQSLELAIDYEHLENLRKCTDEDFIVNDYGYSIDGVFFISNMNENDLKSNQTRLIKDFYGLLNNKKLFSRQANLQAHKLKSLTEMRIQETYRPKLAPLSSRIVTNSARGHLSKKDYSTVLHQKNPIKQQRIQKLKEDKLREEVKGCTFKP